MPPTILSEEDFKRITESYFAKRGYVIARVPEAKKVKRPDYEITRIPRALSYLGELKAPELNLNPDTKLYMHLTKIRKLREFTQKGASQFEAYDARHTKIRILIFNSTHSQFHGRNLLEALHGYIPNNDGTLLADFRSDRIIMGTATDIRKIDLYLWLQISSQKQVFQATYIMNSLSPYESIIRDTVAELSRVPTSVTMKMDQIFQI